MILVYKRGSKFKGNLEDPTKQDIFPLISLPVNAEGAETDLNDFQWWSYTDKWVEWLKKNPREWTAEKQESLYSKTERLLEEIFSQPNPYRDFFNFQVNSLITEKRLSSFDEFTKIYEAEGSGAVTKSFVKLGYAIQSLAKSGKLKTDLDLDSLPEKEQFAIVVDFLNDAGKAVVESRQALRFTKIKDTNRLTLALVDYSIPLGEIKDDSQALLKKVAEYASQVLVAGITVGSLIIAGQVAGTLASGWALQKAARGLYRNILKPEAIANVTTKPGTWARVKDFAAGLFGRGGATTAARVTLPSGAFVEGGMAYSSTLTGNRLLQGAAAQSTKAAAQRLVASGAAEAAGAAAGGAAAAEATNPIGWILLAAQAVGSIGQQTYNWFSDKQAPKFGEVDDFAKGEFKPGSIPVGVPITICWTSDGGAGFWGGVLKAITFSKDDTRTTMDLVKIGDFGGRSIFILLDVHSKQMEQALKENDLILLAFDSDETFERGILDNDDLTFETIAVKDMQQFGIGTSFVGYSTWDEMQEAFNEAPDNPYYVPENAPDAYEFNYVDEKGRNINVSGSLLSSDEIEEVGLDSFVPGATEVSESFNSYKDYKLVNESGRVLSFSEFSSSLVLEKDEKEGKGKIEVQDVESLEKEWAKDFEDSSAVKTRGEAVQARNEGSPYSQVSLPVYRANSIQFVDPNTRGTTPDFQFFIVGDESLDATQDEPITVEVTSDNPVNAARFGLATYTPPKEEEETEETGGEEQETIAPLSAEEPKEFLTTPEDVNIKDKNRRLVISDNATEGDEDINIVEDFVTDDDKKQLGIEDWKTITKITLIKDLNQNPKKIVLRNTFGGSDKVRRIRKGEAGFDAAVDLANRVKSGIKYK
jgi:hypothetical protein